MTGKSLAAKFGVNVMKSTVGLKRRHKWLAFRGGNGTGEPVVEIAEAYTLAALSSKLARKLAQPAGKPLIEVL